MDGRLRVMVGGGGALYTGCWVSSELRVLKELFL